MTAAEHGTTPPAEIRAPIIRAALAEVGYGHLKVEVNPKAKVSGVVVVGPDVHTDPNIRRAVWRASWIAGNREGRARCFDCYVEQVGGPFPPEDFDCGHPKEWR